MEARNSPSSASAKRSKTVGLNTEVTEPEQDYISSLSDTLLHHILSFLDTKYAVQTCILAKRWRYLWNSLRTLKFNNDLFDPDNSDQCDGGFERFGDNVLMLRDNSDIKRFHYKGDGDSVLDYPLHKWILSAVRRNVEELYFDIRFDEIQFPDCLFTCNSLTKLIVETGGSLHKKAPTLITPPLTPRLAPPTAPAPAPIRPSLTDPIRPYLTPPVRHPIMRGLTFSRISRRGLTPSLTVRRGRPYLTAPVRPSPTVPVRPYLTASQTAPLTPLTPTESYEHKQFKIILPNSMDLPQLKTLHLDSVSFVQEDSTNKLFSSCPNLEFLSITNSEFRQMNVRISSPKLKHLRLENNCENFRLFHSLDSKFKLDTPNLTSFTCKDYTSKDYILENVSSVVKADIQMKVEECGEPGAYKSIGVERKQMYDQRMMSFLKALHNVEDLRLSSWFIKVFSRVPNLLESQLTQFCNLRCLKLEIWRSIDSMVAITCLLNVSPLIESLSVKISQVDFYSEDIEPYTETGLPLQCFLYHLKFVEVRGIEGCKSEHIFLENLLKNAIVLEKMMVFSSKELSPSKEKPMNFSEKLLTCPRASANAVILVL